MAPCSFGDAKPRIAQAVGAEPERFRAVDVLLVCALLSRLARAEVHAARAELRNILTRTRCICEDVLAPCDLEVLEAGGHDRGLELCFEQSPGYSVSP